MKRKAEIPAILSWLIVAVLLIFVPAGCRNTQEGDNRPVVIVSGLPMDTLFLTMQSRIYVNPDSIRDLAEEALRVVREEGHTDWQIRMLNLIGVSYAVQSDLIIAGKYYHQALALAKQTDNPLRKGDAYCNLGGLYFLTRSYTDALESNLEAIHQYELTGQYDKISGIHCNTGILYAELNNLDKALYHYHAAYRGFLNLNDQNGMTTVFNRMATAFLKAGMLDSAVLYADKSILLASKTDNWYYLPFSNLVRADICLHQKQHREALVFYERSRETSEKLDNRTLEPAIELGLSKLYLDLNDIPEALRHAGSALLLSDNLKDDKSLQESHELLSEIYSRQADYRQSLHHYKLANDIKLRLSDQSNLHQIYNLEISRLNKDKELQQLDLEKKKLLLGKRNAVIIIITLVFLSVLLVLFFVYSRIRHRQNARMAEASLKHAEERAKAVMAAEIQERKRLGLELHDGIGPMLSLAKLNLSAITGIKDLSETRKLKILSGTVSTIEEMLREIKNISHNMAPVLLTEKGFEAAVRDLSARLAETGKYTVSLDLSGLKGNLGSNLEHTLYRSILELCNNILLHAHGSEISLQVIQNHEDITIMVEDNGKGFRVEELAGSRGLGLRSIRSRVEGLKGKMYIDSMEGRGTIVTLVIPVKENQG